MKGTPNLRNLSLTATAITFDFLGLPFLTNSVLSVGFISYPKFYIVVCILLKSTTLLLLLNSFTAFFSTLFRCSHSLRIIYFSKSSHTGSNSALIRQSITFPSFAQSLHKSPCGASQGHFLSLVPIFPFFENYLPFQIFAHWLKFGFNPSVDYFPVFCSKPPQIAYNVQIAYNGSQRLDTAFSSFPSRISKLHSV